VGACVEDLVDDPVLDFENDKADVLGIEDEIGFAALDGRGGTRRGSGVSGRATSSRKR